MIGETGSSLVCLWESHHPPRRHWHTKNQKIKLCNKQAQSSNSRWRDVLWHGDWKRGLSHSIRYEICSDIDVYQARQYKGPIQELNLGVHEEMDCMQMLETWSWNSSLQKRAVGLNELDVGLLHLLQKGNDDREWQRSTIHHHDICKVLLLGTQRVIVSSSSTVHLLIMWTKSWGCLL